MGLNASDIRCSNDAKLHEVLSKDRHVNKAQEAVEHMEQTGPSGVRRRLLATSVRLSASMAPEIHRMKDECAEKLGTDIPIELYAYNSAQFNAACIKPEKGRLFIMFSSGLLEAFRQREMQFVMGHELGHHLYGHHDIPIGYILRGPERPDAKLALQLFTWSRYAEVSADRAGAHCAQDFEVVARSLFRLASGLSDRVVRFSLREFLDQLDDMQAAGPQPGHGAPMEDWFSTHPFSPLRVKALEFFFKSAFVRQPGLSAEELETAVQGLMALMEPSYIDGRTRTAEAMRRLLFAGAILVADASNGIDDREIKRFEAFFGRGTFSDSLDIDMLRRQLPMRIQQVREHASVAQRLQVLRDLCLMAQAGGPATRAERKVLTAIAEALNVSPSFVEAGLAQPLDLD